MNSNPTQSSRRALHPLVGAAAIAVIVMCLSLIHI